MFSIGIVESNIDPLGLGRCKIRVVKPNLDGITHTEDLPFSNRGISSKDYIAPEIGEFVYVGFIGNDKYNRLYFGRVDDIKIAEIDMGVTSRETFSDPATPEYPYNYGMLNMNGKWIDNKGPSLPMESQIQIRYKPTVTVLHKSIKGHTILTDDTDGNERLKLIDRLGQQMEMISSISKPDNNNVELTEKNKRILGTSEGIAPDNKENENFQEIISNQPPEVGIRLIDVNGQEIKLSNVNQLSKIEFSSINSKDNKIYCKLEMTKDGFSVKNVNNGIVYNTLKITPEGLAIDVHNITVNSDNPININADVNIDGNVSVTKDVIADSIIEMEVK